MDKRIFCDCGKPLKYAVDKIVINVQYTINKNGRLSKRPIKGTDGNGSSGQSLNFGVFMCTSNACENQYEFNGMIGGQVLRGDLL